MKRVDIKKLAPDSILQARASAGVNTIVVAGFIRSVDDDTVALCETREDDNFVEYPRSAIVAAFEDDGGSELTLVVRADATVRVVALVSADLIGWGAGWGINRGCERWCLEKRRRCLKEGKDPKYCRELYYQCLRQWGCTLTPREIYWAW